MNNTRLSELLKNGEGLTAEFKRCSGCIEHDVFETICAFLNRFGGDVLLGVENDGTVVGVKGDAVALRNNIMNVANDGNSFEPVAYIAPEIVEYDGKTIICIRVPASGEVHSYKGVVYDRNGVDVTKLKTWDDFVKEGQRITIPQKRYMIDMADDSMISLIILLSQHGFDLFDAYGNVAFDKPGVADVVAWFVKQTSGKTRIAFPAGDGQNFYQAMNEGLDLFFLTPDWRTAQFQLDNPRQKGNLALMPLPYWADENGEPLPGSYRTGTWGGSGLAITKHCKNQDLAWKFAKFLYTKVEDLGERFALTNILPPVRASWELPEFKQKSDFYKHMFHDEATGELKADFVSIGEIYGSQADFTPPRYVTAYTTQAETQLLNVYYAARDHYLKHGDEGLMELIQKDLKEKADYVRSLVARNVFLTRDAEKAAAAAKAAAETKSEQEQ